MEVILRAAEGSASPADLGGVCYMPPVKAFIDDTTILCSKENKTRRMLDRLDALMNWSRMSFQAEEVPKTVHKDRLIGVAMYCRKAKLRLPLKSIVEEYTCGKARLMTMFEDSEEDPAVTSIQPQLRSFRKWKVHEADNQAKRA
ncbi:reverse transcriptase [Plakobranchus ocellatus]|uniref:Reverse transcriptase n=1 Tax=Plakobranchus ocellatus TaxID=259542 RepID=A0AAV4CT35_9GAST|nr:reverse transcriptase [Plakobranchus ocellatus]